MEVDQQNKEEKVMVAIDESEYSRYALEWALQNLNESIVNKQLIVFTAQSISDYTYLHASSYGSTPPELIRNIQENQKRIALSLLDQAKDLCSKYGITAKTMTESGDAKDLICEAVEKLNVQLLVLGSHSRGPIKRAFLGSVSNHCVQHVKCPVLIVKKTVLLFVYSVNLEICVRFVIRLSMAGEDVKVRATESGMKNKVMVAIDDSEFSEYALKWALETLTSTLFDSELLIYTARTPVDIGYLYASSWGTSELIKELKESEKKASLDLLKKAKTTCSNYGISAEGIADIGDPKVAICNAVDKLNVQLLVVGSHGRGAVTRTILGSVSKYCVHHAKCPVLVVKKTD
ncbi:uncharacterized protein [Rutidosis leptorrhynchoides]|uniref:uncharacterized protein n=1 Tax=Rutidosis leptorrhynchoides TaxID=125765 RepID=UPI003A9A2C34